MAENALTTFLSNVGEFFTSAIGWLGDALEVIMSNPALFVLVLAIPTAGVAIGFLKRLLYA